MEIFRKRPGIIVTAVLLAGSVAQAAVINYSTSGAFDGGASNVKTVGSVTVTFLGATGPVNANPATFASLGQIVATGAAVSEDLTGTTLTITVFQTAPGPAGSDVFSTTLTGTISGTSSQATIDFGGTQLAVINGVRYENVFSSYELVPPSAGGVTTIQGLVTVPEPGTTALFSIGFALIAVVGRKLRSS